MRRPVQPTAQTVHIPAPRGGLNTVATGTAVPDGDCLQLWNMLSGEYGLRARRGYRFWGSGATDADLNPTSLRTVMPYTGIAANGANDAVYVVTTRGIQQMRTDATVSPSIEFSVSDRIKQDVGRGIYCSFVASGGGYLLYCDEAAGYHVYSESSGTWLKMTQGGGGSQIQGVDPANFCFVMTWKSRVWFVEKGTTNVWYLPAGQVFGTATKLSLTQAAQFRQGGELIGLWSWTLDGGVGIDDYLVAVSRGGDVAIYQGTDPASATTFSIHGTWNAGAFVAGRRVATNFGGDVLLLTKSGIRQLSQLVSGQDGQQTYATSKISNLFNAMALDRANLPGWDMCLNPEENALIVTVPDTDGNGLGDYNTQQFALSLWDRSWSRFRGLPISCMASWKGQLYFGDADASGILWVSDGYTDNNRLGVGGAEGTAVQWALLTGFSDMGVPNQKQVGLIRPTILCEAYPPTFTVAARYNLDLSELAAVTEVAGTAGDLFDIGKWDSAIWRDDFTTTRAVRGTTGLGTHVAIALRGTSRSRTVLVGADVSFTRGGVL